VQRDSVCGASVAGPTSHVAGAPRRVDNPTETVNIRHHGAADRAAEHASATARGPGTTVGTYCEPATGARAPAMVRAVPRGVGVGHSRTVMRPANATALAACVADAPTSTTAARAMNAVSIATATVLPANTLDAVS
jgi:hypothetical protein